MGCDFAHFAALNFWYAQAFRRLSLMRLDVVKIPWTEARTSINICIVFWFVSIRTRYTELNVISLSLSSSQSRDALRAPADIQRSFLIGASRNPWRQSCGTTNSKVKSRASKAIVAVLQACYRDAGIRRLHQWQADCLSPEADISWSYEVTGSYWKLLGVTKNKSDDPMIVNSTDLTEVLQGRSLVYVATLCLDQKKSVHWWICEVGGSVKLEGCPYQCWKVIGFGGQVRLRSDAAFLVALQSVVKRQVFGLRVSSTFAQLQVLMLRQLLFRGRRALVILPYAGGSFDQLSRSAALRFWMWHLQFSTAVYTHFL